MKRTDRVFGSLLRPCPSIFDFFVAGILFISLFTGTRQGLFFVLYSFFIALLTLSMKPKRNYISFPLMLIAIWAMIGIFLHNRVVIYPKNSFMNSYFVLSTMFEGAIYVVAGVLLLNSIVRYSSNLKFVWMLMPFASIFIFSHMVRGGSMTILFAVAVSLLIYAFLKKRFALAVSSLLLGIGMFALNYPWVLMKWETRPLVWQQLIKGIKSHPFVGNGFCEYLWGNMTWIEPDKFGWAYRHNDYLSIGGYLGIPALIFAAWFVIDTCLKIRIRPLLIVFMAIAITCFFQMTMFYPDRGMLCLLMTGICLSEAIKKEDVCGS